MSINSCRIPGKLMFTGEWSILTPGNACIALPTSRCIEVFIEPATRTTIVSPTHVTGAVELAQLATHQTPAHRFLHLSLTTALSYLEAIGITHLPFALTINGNEHLVKLPHGNHSKLGLGSSASTCVGIVKAVLGFHEVTLAKQELFKLAAIAHYQVQNFAGSGYDVATPAFGSGIYYRSCDPQWLQAALTRHDHASLIHDQVWPGLFIQPLTIPSAFQISVAFSGESASTLLLIARYRALQRSQPAEVTAITTALQEGINAITHALASNNATSLIMLVRENRRTLQRLSQLMGDSLETPAIKRLCEAAEAAGGAAKFSGAGGGDCVIGVTTNPQSSAALFSSWSTNLLVGL